jgi:ribosomal protein L40E
MVWQSVGAQSNIFYNQTFRLIAPSEDSCYYFSPAYVYNSAGSTVVGSITVGLGKVDFYILNSGENQQFLSRKGGCGNITPPLSELKVTGINSSYAVNYLVPDSGYHYFLFLNPYPSNVAVTLVLGWAASATTYQPVTGYSYPTSYSSVASQPSLSLFTFNYDAYLILGGGVLFLLVAGAVVIFMIWKRRGPIKPSLPADLASKPASETALQKAEPETGPKAETPLETEKSQQEMAFCIKCGKELPADWEFCRYCGTKQPVLR